MGAPADDTVASGSTQAQLLRAPAATAISGLLFFGLFLAASLLIHKGFGGTPVEALRAKGLDDVSISAIRASLYLLPFVVITFLWFMGVTRTQLGRHEDQLFATVFIGSGLLTMAMLLIGTGLATALAAKGSGATELTGPAREVLARMIWVFWYVLAPKMGGCFILVTTTMLYRVKFLPKWLALVSVLVGYATLLAVTRFSWSLYALPSWVAAISVLVLVREYGPGRRAVQTAA